MFLRWHSTESSCCSIALNHLHFFVFFSYFLVVVITDYVTAQDNKQSTICVVVFVYAIARLTLFLCCFVYIHCRCCVAIDVYVALFYFSTWANCYSTTSCCSLVMLCVAFAYYVFERWYNLKVQSKQGQGLIWFHLINECFSPQNIYSYIRSLILCYSITFE